MPSIAPATTMLPLLSALLTLLLPLSASAVQEEAIDKLRGLERLPLNSTVGPESLAFDRSGGGPYTGVSDGRVLKWEGQGLGWTVFAVPSRQRVRGCDGSQSGSMESVCGRPLGLQFNRATGDLYIADASYGLLAVGPEGGVAARLAAAAGGEAFGLTNGLDVDQGSGMVYFTDSSTRFQRRDYVWAVITGDATGRLMRYDPESKKLTVLIKGLKFPNGVAVSKDNSFLLIAETTTCRILRYWLRGRRSGTFDVFAQLPGYPDNIKTNPAGEFWVALSQEKVRLDQGLPMEHPVAVRLSGEGRVLEVLDGRSMTSISEVAENNGTLWFGSVIMPYVGVYKL